MKNVMSDNAVRKNFNDFMYSELLEPEYNNVASTYMAEHYNEIIANVRKMPNIHPDKVEDLVNDVVESILRSENNGEPYSDAHSNEGSYITVAEFVYGRLKLYAKNDKYSRNGHQRHSSVKKINGNAVKVVDMDVMFASSNCAELEEMDSIQRAYALAPSYDDLDDVNTAVSIRKDIEFCIDFNDVVGLDMLDVIKNISMLDEHSDFDTAMFSELRKSMKYHDEFGTAFKNVVECAANHREIFDKALATFTK